MLTHFAIYVLVTELFSAQQSGNKSVTRQGKSSHKVFLLLLLFSFRLGYYPFPLHTGFIQVLIFFCMFLISVAPFSSFPFPPISFRFGCRSLCVSIRLVFLFYFSLICLVFFLFWLKKCFFGLYPLSSL